MARNPTRTHRQSDASLDDDNTNAQAQTTGLSGGALGVIQGAEQHVGGMRAQVIRREEPEEATKAKWYRVLNGGSVNWAGSKTRIPAGKMYADNQVDIKNLERQGIIFQEIDSPE